VRVNDDTGTNSQFLPHISLDQSSGNVAVTWYDCRNSPSNKTAQYFGAISTDGGASFGGNFQISAGTSSEASSIAALKDADYGDYTGNAFASGVLIPAWGDNSNSTGDNPNGATDFDVYTAPVYVLPTLGMVNTRTNLVLSWPTNAASFVLQESPDLISWTNSTRTLTTNSTQRSVTISPLIGNKFFRLYRP